jgi:hypothetical protein
MQMSRFNRNVVAGSSTPSDKNQLWEVPQPKRDPQIALADLVDAAEITAIEQAGEIQFQAMGDTGVGLDSQQPEVAEALARDINVAHPEKGPIFCLNLGDIIYGPKKKSLYSNRFYRPNMPYLHPAPGFDGIILGIPGNHDGEVRDPDDSPSLTAFWENFVSDPGTNPPLAQSFGVVMPNQPGAYWHLQAPFLDLIGLYSNAAEDFGLLGKDAADSHQQTWLEQELKAIRGQRSSQQRKALIFAMHHPPYSLGLQEHGANGGHPGSPAMQAQLDAACASAGIWPDAVLSGHSHCYQRYRRQCKAEDGQVFDIAYFVAGTGGIKTQPAPIGIGRVKVESGAPGLAKSTVTYGNGLESYGYLRISATPSRLAVTFVRTERNHRQEFETVTIDLESQTQIAP